MKKILIISGILVIILMSGCLEESEEPLWKDETPGSIMAIDSTEDTVVVGSKGGVVSAYTIDGILEWRFKTEGDVGSVAISKDTVVAGSADKNIYVFDKDKGELKWKTLIGEFPKVAVSEDVVAVGAYDNELYVLNKNNGNIIWNRSGSENIENIFFIEIYKNTLAVATGDIESKPKMGYVYAFDIDTGEELWNHKKTKTDGWAYILAVSDDTIAVGVWKEKKGEGEISVFDKNKEGDLKWKHPTTDEVTSVAVFGDSIAFGVGMSYDEDKVYLVDKDTGDVQWEEHVRSPFIDVESPFSMQWIALTEGSVVIASRDGRIYVYEKETGCERWSYKTGADVHTTITASGGKVFAGSLDRNIYAFNEGEIGSGTCPIGKNLDEDTRKTILIIGSIIILIFIIFLFLLFTGRIKL